MSDWHVQIRITEWVLWGYGPERMVEHIEAACTHVNMGPKIGTFSMPFELPEHRKGSTLPPPVEYERKVAVGWRFKTNDLLHDCGWNLADSEEDALKAARAWAQERRNPHKGVPLEAALDDIRRILDPASEK